MSVKLLTEYHVVCLSLKGDCTGSSESALVEMPHCWKSHVAAHIVLMPKKYFFYFTFLPACCHEALMFCFEIFLVNYTETSANIPNVFSQKKTYEP